MVCLLELATVSALSILWPFVSLQVTMAHIMHTGFWHDSLVQYSFRSLSGCSLHNNCRQKASRSLDCFSFSNSSNTWFLVAFTRLWALSHSPHRNSAHCLHLCVAILEGQAVQPTAVGARLTLTKSIRSRRVLSRGQVLSTLLTLWVTLQVGHWRLSLCFVLFRHSKQREWRHGSRRACFPSSLYWSLQTWHSRNFRDNWSGAKETWGIGTTSNSHISMLFPLLWWWWV